MGSDLLESVPQIGWMFTSTLSGNGTNDDDDDNDDEISQFIPWCNVLNV